MIECIPYDKLTIDYLNRQRTINVVTRKTNVPFWMMENKTRKREVVVARQLAMFLIYIEGKHSLNEIGEIFGSRDHSTVINANRTVLALYDTDRYFKVLVQDLIDEINPELIKELEKAKTKLNELIK